MVLPRCELGSVATLGVGLLAVQRTAARREGQTSWRPTAARHSFWAAWLVRSSELVQQQQQQQQQPPANHGASKGSGGSTSATAAACLSVRHCAMLLGVAARLRRPPPPSWSGSLQAALLLALPTASLHELSWAATALVRSQRRRLPASLFSSVAACATMLAAEPPTHSGADARAARAATARLRAALGVLSNYMMLPEEVRSACRNARADLQLGSPAAMCGSV